MQAQQPAQQVGPGVQLTGRRTKANKLLLLQLLETFRSYRPGEKALTHIMHVDKTQSSCGCRSVVCLCALPLPRTRGEGEAVIGCLCQPPLTCPVIWQLIRSLIIPDYCCPIALGLSSIKWPFCSHSADLCFQ